MFKFEPGAPICFRRNKGVDGPPSAIQTVGLARPISGIANERLQIMRIESVEKPQGN